MEYKINPTDEQLVKWKEEKKISNFQGTRLNLSEKQSFGWGIEELIIEDCPNLINLNLKRFSQTNQADEVQERWMGSHNEQRTEFNGQLTKLTINNCPQLKWLDASCNNLVNENLIIDEESRTNLTDLDLHNNKQLTSFQASLCPQLETLNLDHCNLEGNGVNIEGLTNLKNFSASGNNLTQLELEKLGANNSLVNLTANNNQLRQIKVTHLKNLQSLLLFENNLESLDVSGIKNLVDVNIYANGYYITKEIFCKGQVLEFHEFHGIRNLQTEGCEKIESLDIDLNYIKNLNFSHLKNLNNISLRQNGEERWSYLDEDENQRPVRRISRVMSKVDQKLVLNSAHLKLIDTKFSNIKEIINKGIVWDPLNPQSFLATLNNPKQFRIIDNSTDEANWHPDAPTLWEQIVIEQEQQKLREELALDEFSTQSENDQTIITDISQLTNNYPNFCEKNKNQSFLDISHMNLMKNLIIDDWPNLRELNVGNNFLSYLVVKNCPQLTTLRYAHNAMRHDAFIENCDNLTTIDKEKYHDSSWDKDLEELFKKDELKPQIDNSEKNSQDLIPDDQIIAQIIILLEQAEQALAQQDYPKLKELITQIKELISQVKEGLDMEQSQEQLARLEQACLVQENTFNKWPLIIGSVTFFLVPITLYLLITKWIYKVKKPK
ncbi:MAG: hypothetical protein GBAus27B_000072 [Mycoplasmataceae bacterium]|nr:MAG: hypothetical protein GBAus27B_000072 [Mycoplasmataceae bacterium]